MREERQRPGLACNPGHQRIDERRLDDEADALRGELDRAAKLFGLHGSHEDVAAPEQGGEVGIPGAAPVVGRANREDDHRSPAGVSRQRRERRDELERALPRPGKG